MKLNKKIKGNSDEDFKKIIQLERGFSDQEMLRRFPTFVVRE